MFVKKNYWLLIVSGICLSNPFFAQNNELQSVHGNFQIEAQDCKDDTIIGTQKVDERFRYNAFGNVNYSSGAFSAGFRFESYNPVMLGFLPGYSNRSGIAYRYARYRHKDVDITVGNFYDQFGSGMIFRSYEERNLLYDNAMNGFRAVLSPFRGITIKGIVGRQRVFWGESNGVVKGVDGELNVNELLDTTVNWNTKIILGGSFVSKYEADNNPSKVLPKNVGCYGGRVNIINGGFNFMAEYAYKINDPNLQNKESYKDGEGLYVSSSYATNGFSVLVSGKYIDNMNYRSSRDAQSTMAMINFLPALTKPHSYMMVAYYPYASQPNGEVGGMAELQYKFKKGTLLGGKYGMDVALNGSIFHGTDTTRISETLDSIRQLKYSVNRLGLGKKYFHDINIEITKKFSKKVKSTFMYSNQYLNQAIVMFNTPDNSEHPDIYSHSFVADITYKYKSSSAIRFESQLFIGEYKKELHSAASDAEKFAGVTGSWITGAIEWTPIPNLFIIVSDQYNYENPYEYKKVHYYYGGITYVSGPSRFMISYGRQRQGIFCAGGVCRQVPAFSGLSISISSSF